jgi:hypothetical protein
MFIVYACILSYTISFYILILNVNQCFKMLNGKQSITYHLAIMDYYNHNMILQ